MSSLPASHSYLQQHYISPEEPSKDSRLRFLKKFVTRCITHFTRSQNEFNANVVRTLDAIHQRAEKNEHHYLELSNALAQATNALRQQQRINKRAEETQEHMAASAKSLQDMQNHHGAVIAQTLQQLTAVEQSIGDKLDKSRLKFENRAEVTDSKIKDMANRQDDLVALLESFRKETLALTKRNDTLVKQLHDTDKRQLSFEKSFSSLFDRVNDINKRQDDLVALLESFKRETNGVSKRIDDIVVHVNGSNKRQDDLISSVKTIAAQSNAISKRQDELIHLLEIFRKTTSDLSQRHDLLVNQMHDADKRCGNLEKQAEAIVAITAQAARIDQFESLQASLQKALQRIALIRDAFDEAVVHIPASAAPKKDTDAFISSVLECKYMMDDAAYEAFEDANRGSDEEILERLKVYVPKLSNIKTTPKSYILDIGCGRGEFLQLLTDNGMHAKGIDINKAAVAHAKAKGLSVKCADMFAVLEKLKPDTVAGISAFHVIEHLPFDQIYRFIELSFSRLIPGGVIMLETPNALNLRVAACEFYRDPTHVKPVHPSTLDHALQQAGFTSIEFDFLHPFPAQDSLTVNSKTFSKATSHNFKTLNDLILGCRDCAVTASKQESS